ncbi:diguanylate cyclase [Vibrio profundi]|uniref:transporter substrate-binding domain-containing diguanylate cyclase n=1 Tax=Vibrio profundi TaxID=1774960 RepID=UPI003734D35B
MNKRLIVFSIISLLAMLASSVAHAKSEDSKTLIIANSKAWKPFSYIDEKGEPNGILIDLWKEYSRRTGVDVEFKLTDWNESLMLVKNGQADAHAGLLWSAPRDEFLDYSDTLLTIDTHLFMVQDYIGTDLNYFLAGDEGKSIGVVEGGYEQYFAEQNFPNLQLDMFVNNEQMFNAALKGKLTAFIADTQVANFYLYTSKAEVQIAPVMFLYSGDLKVAVAEGNQALLESIDTGFSSLSRKDREQILSKWMHIKTVYPPYFVPSLILVVFGIIFIYAIQLKRTVKERTLELEKANRELVRVVNTDELTGVSNRRHFFKQITNLDIGVASVTVMVFDIDDFKQINDNFGHNVGDIVIQAVASRAANSLDYKHLFARIGGEEFAVVSFGLSCEQAQLRAQGICDAISERPVKCRNRYIQTSVSLGCAYYEMQPEVVLLNDADHLMYESKKSGKNQITLQRY